MSDQSVIFFIEDETDHFEAVRRHLEPDYRCICYGAKDLARIESEAEKHKPVAAVVDIMLFSSAAMAKKADDELDELSKQMKQGKFRKGEVEQAEVWPVESGPKGGQETIEIFQKVRPGMPIIVYSQLYGESDETVGVMGETTVRKVLDTNRQLVNGKEIADVVRQAFWE